MVKLIVAIASNNVIGKNNDLIWNLPADMRFFTQATKNHIVVMGRKNWRSIPSKYRPLSDRLNIVVSRDTTFSDTGCTVFHSIEGALDSYKNDKRDIFIIGGGQIYRYCLENNLVDEMLVTKIEKAFEGDTFFPEIRVSLWNTSLIMSHDIDEKNAYAFNVWRYIKK
jgi:dihydrofolate reductase